MSKEDPNKKKFPFSLSNPFNRNAEEKKNLPELNEADLQKKDNNNNAQPQENFNPLSGLTSFVKSKFGSRDDPPPKKDDLISSTDSAPQTQPTNSTQPTPEGGKAATEGTNLNPFQKIGNFVQSKFAKEDKGIGINLDVATYDEMLNFANTLDFTVEETYKCLYIGGYDILRRPVLITNPNTLPATVNFDRLLLFVIKFMDKIVESDYALIYIRQTEGKPPGFGWLRKAYKLLGRKYKKNLKALYIIYPTFWIKGIMRLFKPFISQKFWQKLHYIEEISELYRFVPRENIAASLPVSVLETSKLKSSLFGSTLEEVMGREDHEDLEIPGVILTCIFALIQKEAHLTTGIFRLSGSTKIIQDLRKEFNTRKIYEIKLDSVQEIHALSSLLKQYLRELPEPVFPVDQYDKFMKGITLANRTQLTQHFAEYCSEMPPLNQSVLRWLLLLLYFISAHSEINQMTPSNLAIVIAPNILRCPSTIPPEDAMKHGMVHTTLFGKMITYAPDLLPVLSKDKPPALIFDFLLDASKVIGEPLPPLSAELLQPIDFSTKKGNLKSSGFFSGTRISQTESTLLSSSPSKNSSTSIRSSGNTPNNNNSISSNNNNSISSTTHSPAHSNNSSFIGTQSDPFESTDSSHPSLSEAPFHRTRGGARQLVQAGPFDAEPLIDLTSPEATRQTEFGAPQKQINPFEDDSTEKSQSDPEPRGAQKGKNTTKAQYPQLFCLYDYAASDAGELSFKSGDLLLLLSGDKEQEEEDWWRAKNPSTHEEGQIPKNYVKKV